MNKKQTPDDVAAVRLRMITPLLDEQLDASQLIELKKKISEDNNLSYRSISRYLEAYTHGGFAGLKPKTGYTRESKTLPDNFGEIVEHAIILRRECPTRSVTDIIRILELEAIIKPGTVHRSTLQRHLQSKGFGASQVKLKKVPPQGDLPKNTAACFIRVISNMDRICPLAKTVP
jgi:hypothetical protein